MKRIDQLLQGSEDDEFAESGYSAGDTYKPIHGVWMLAHGTKAYQRLYRNTPGYDSDILGGVAGFDFKSNDKLTLGAALGYNHSIIRSHLNHFNTTEINNYSLQLYSLYDQGKYYIATGASVGLSKFSGKRKLNVGDLQDIALADYRGVNSGMTLSGGYHWKKVGKWEITPTTDFNFGWNRVNSYAESGAGALNLVHQASISRTLEGGLGIKVDRDYVSDNYTLTPTFKVGFHHEFLGESATSRMAFAGAQAVGFSSTSPSPARDRINLGVGFDMVNISGLTISAAYDLNLKKKYTSHTGALKIRWEF